MRVIFCLYVFIVIENLLIFIININVLRTTIEIFNGKQISFIEGFFRLKANIFTIHNNKNWLCYLILKRTTEIIK